MADKVLQTRIINKHADLDRWLGQGEYADAGASSLQLKEGEVALAKIMITQPDETGRITENPAYLMKVGVEGKTFSESPWLFAKASDVYGWAKAATKPGYIATEITRGASNVAADLSAVEQDIVNLKAAVGENGSVAEAIKAAIEALDVEDAAVANQFVTAVAEADGKISVTRRALSADDIPTLEIAKIDGLQNALDLKADETYVDQKDNAITARLAEGGDVYTSIVAAKKAGTDAQSYAEGVNTTLTTYKTNNDARVKEIEDDYTTAEAAGTIAQGKVDALVTTGQVKTNTENIANNAAAIAALAGEGNTSTVKANADAIAKLAADIGNVANVMNFIGVSTTNPETHTEVEETIQGVVTIDGEVYSGVAGDVIIYSEKEYVFDGTTWVKFGDASDSSTAIAGLQTRVGTIETRLDTGDIHQSIVAAKAQADKGVQDAATAQAKANSNETAIGVINGTGEGSIAKALADAKAYADTAESDAVQSANGYTDGEIDKVEESVTNLTTTVNNNATTAANATKAVADDLAAYKTSNNAAVEAAAAKGQQGIEDAAAALKAANDLADGQVNTNKEDIVTLKSDVDAIETNFAKVKTVEGVHSLVVGADEDVIIFDCGGAE